MPRVAVLDESRGVALEMADWSVLPLTVTFRSSGII